MSVSARTRFEIFKRDGFRCVYCGGDPMAAPLHVDHVIPSSKGGTDDPSNLVTSCGPCNLGKSNIALERAKFTTEMVQEEHRQHLDQIRAFLEFQQEKSKVEKDIIQSLVDVWADLDDGYYPSSFEQRIPALLPEFGFDDLRRAIQIANGYVHLNTLRRWKIFHGIIRRWRTTGERTA